MSSAFRITQRTVASSAMGNLQANLARMEKLQGRLSSGRAIQRPSDSPTGTISALRLRGDLRRSDQLLRNAQDGLAWLGTADTSLTDGIGFVRSARDLLLRGANASMSASDRQALAAEVDGLRESLFAVANSTYLDQPVFAGTATTALAYDTSGNYLGNAGQITRSVGPGLQIRVNLTGDEVFGPAGSDVFTVLEDLADHLRNDPDALTATDLGRVDGAFLRMQNALSTVGSRYHQIEIMQARTETNKLSSTTHLSEVEGVDLPAAIVELQLQEVAYQAALGATSRVLQPSLVDFLR